MITTLQQKIVTIPEAIRQSERLRQENKQLVIAGGCFDILHVGHIVFLTASKAQGDRLFILLESDHHIATLKGKNRPLQTQADRALILAALAAVDRILLLPNLPDNTFYDNLVIQLKPAIITTTKADPGRIHKERQAKRLAARVIDVGERITTKSTTELVQTLTEL